MLTEIKYLICVRFFGRIYHRLIPQSIALSKNNYIALKSISKHLVHSFQTIS